MTTAPLAEILAALDIRGSVAAVESAIMAAYDTGKQDGIALARKSPWPIVTAAYEAGLAKGEARDTVQLSTTRPPPLIAGAPLTPEAQAVADALSGMPRVGGELPEPECGMVVTFIENGGERRRVVTETPCSWEHLMRRQPYFGPYRPPTGDHTVSIEDRRGNVIWLAK